MPPRPGKKSPGKKPSPKTSKQSPASDSSAVDALPPIAEEKVPQIDTACDDILAELEAPPSLDKFEEEIYVGKKSPDKQPSPKTSIQTPASDSSAVDALPPISEEKAPQVDTASDDVLAEVEAPPSLDKFEEEISVKDEQKIEEPEQLSHPVGEELNNQLEYEEFSEDKGFESDDKEAQSESGESVEDQGVDDHEEVGDAVARLEVDRDNAEGVDRKDDYTNDVDVNYEEKEDAYNSLYMQAALAEGRKQKELEIFVGGLDKEAVEEDLMMVFGVFGEVQYARIVRHPTTKKSKGFAFIRFANSEHATKALTDLKDGTEIKGKRVRIQASQDKATLYLGNICKIWTKDNVVEKLKSLGIEQIDNMILPSDSKNKEKIKGFAFLEFSSHSDAMLAFQRLKKPDADFGRDQIAKVGFAKNPLPHSEDVQFQVKTIYVNDIPLSWDEEKITEICKEYGQIEKVLLSRNLNSSKRKYFGFVVFSSCESALACVDGINKAQIVDGDSKVTANLVRPLSNSRIAKQGTKGDFKAKKDGETFKGTVGNEKKRKAKLEENKNSTRNAKRSKPFGSQIRDYKGKTDPHTTLFKRKKSSGNDMDTDAYPSSKKTRPIPNNDKAYGRQFGNRKSTHSAISKPRHVARTAAYPATSYQLHPSDLVPHAGYIPALTQVSKNYEYERRRPGIYNSELRNSFGSGTANLGIPPSYYSHTDYSSYQSAGHRHQNRGANTPYGPYY